MNSEGVLFGCVPATLAIYGAASLMVLPKQHGLITVRLFNCARCYHTLALFVNQPFE